MKVKAIGATEKSGKSAGNAHGLLRQLQNGTFRGASIEKHRARFADRLAAAQEEPEANPSASNATDPAPPQVDAADDGLAPRLGQYVDYVV